MIVEVKVFYSSGNELFLITECNNIELLNNKKLF